MENLSRKAGDSVPVQDSVKMKMWMKMELGSSSEKKHILCPKSLCLDGDLVASTFDNAQKSSLRSVARSILIAASGISLMPVSSQDLDDKQMFVTLCVFAK